MRKLFLAAVLFVAALVSKPVWEDQAEKYVDLSFLDPFDNAAEEAGDLTRRIAEGMGTLVGETESSLPELAEKPALDPADAVVAVHNVTLGMTQNEAQAETGMPLRLMQNEYGTDWHSYHQDYQNYVLLSYDENKAVNGMFTNQDIFVSSKGISMDSTRESVRETMGEPLEYLRKGMIQYMFDSKDEYDVFRTEDAFVTVFYDIHESNTVTAIQVISEELENSRRDIYAPPSEALKEGYEFLLFELTNSARIQRELPLLVWDDQARSAARKHSIDMAENRYFSHTNLAGQSPFERMEEEGITFYTAGENLAYGQYSSIFAQEGLMNSEGHRENILKPEFGYLGVGVAFNEENQPFFTAKFFDK